MVATPTTTTPATTRPPMQFKRGRDERTEELFYKILLYGESGAGKTWLAATSGPGTIVVLTERNGEQSVRLANPDARYVVVGTIGEVREILRAAQADLLSSEEDPVTTIVFDGLTEIQRLFKDEMLAIKKSNGEAEPTMSVADWGDLTEAMRRFLRFIRDLPVNVVCTALAESEMEGETRHVFPAFQGKKLYSEVMQFFNAVGYVYRKGPEEHVAMFDGPSRFSCKPSFPLRGTRPGPVVDWLAELSAAATKPAAPATAEGAPAEPAAKEPVPASKEPVSARRGARGAAKKGDDPPDPH